MVHTEYFFPTGSDVYEIFESTAFKMCRCPKFVEKTNGSQFHRHACFCRWEKKIPDFKSKVLSFLRIGA